MSAVSKFRRKKYKIPFFLLKILFLRKKKSLASKNNILWSGYNVLANI